MIMLITHCLKAAIVFSRFSPAPAMQKYRRSVVIHIFLHVNVRGTVFSQ